MKFLLRHRALFIFSIAGLLVLVMAFASLVTSGRISPVSNFFGNIFRPIQTFLTSTTVNIGKVFSGSVMETDLEAENAELRIRVAELEEQIRNAEEAVEENKQLKELIGLKELRPDFQLTRAPILSRDLSNWARTLTLNVGSLDEIEVGDCVLSAEGYLVGMVSEVGLTWSTVTTVIDTDMDAAALIYRTGQAGVAEGSFNLMKNGKLGLFHIPVDSDVQTGDIVLTSGLGGFFPQDIPIGKITNMTIDSSSISAIAEIEPYARLDAYQVVYVVTYYDERGYEAFDSDRTLIDRIMAGRSGDLP